MGKGRKIKGNVPKFRGNISAGKYRNYQRLFTKCSYENYVYIGFRSLHKYQLRSRSVPPSDVGHALDHGQGAHTLETEGITQSDVGEGLQGRISPGLMAHGISASAAGPEVESSSSGEKTLGSVPQDRASRVNSSETMPILSPVSELRVPPIRIGRRPIADIGQPNPSDTLTILPKSDTPEIQKNVAEIQSVSETKLFISPDSEITFKPAKMTTTKQKQKPYGSHAGSRTGATDDTFQIPSYILAYISASE